jgi:hypothetical protein
LGWAFSWAKVGVPEIQNYPIFIRNFEIWHLKIGTRTTISELVPYRKCGLDS